MATGINLQEFGHHPHIPQLDDAVCIAGGHCVTLQIKHGMIASIGMAIESLDTKSSTQIPKGDGFVTRCCEDIVGERLKGDKIHRVHMPAEGLAASHAGHVEGFDRLILRQSW